MIDTSTECKCKLLKDMPGMVNGWGCCKCRVFNADWRPDCKHCEHRPRPHPYGQAGRN